jgi:hypothetical protein
MEGQLTFPTVDADMLIDCMGVSDEGMTIFVGEK